MTKEEVFKKCSESKNGVILQEKNFKKHFPEIYDELNNFVKDNISFLQKLYNYFHDLKEIPKTLCGKNRTFRSFTYGYNDFCSSNCKCMVESCNKKKRETSVKKYGVEHPMMLEKNKKHLSEVKLSYSKEKKKEIADKKRNTLYEHYGNDYGKVIEERTFKIYGVKNVSQVPEIAAKIKQTNIDKYGGIGFASNRLREKGRKTNEKIHGDKNYNNNEQRKQTCKEKYGSEYYISSVDGKTKIKKSFIEKYGVDNPSKLEHVRNTISEKVSKKCIEKLKEKNPEILEVKNDRFLVKCDEDCICGGTFEITDYLFLQRKRYGLTTCTSKNPVLNNRMKQNFIYEYISSIYNGTIRQNDRKALNGKEIDIYLPDLKIGFEFNGDFWHMNPDIFNENYINPLSKITAKDKWKEDKEKILLAESLDISLMTIWEHEWDSNPEIVKEKILNLINKKKT